MKNVITRALSGLVYVILIIGAILLGPKYFFILSFAFLFVGLSEFFNITGMAEKSQDEGKKFSFITLIDYLGPLFVLSMATLYYLGGLTAGVIFLIVSGFFVFRATAALYDKRPNAFVECAKSVLATVYLSVPLLMLNMLYGAELPSTKWIVLMMFVMIWLNDTGAFCFGSMLGRRKLFERLSPKKSWEGFWGGMFCCIVCGVICSFCFDIPHFDIVTWIIFSILISVFSTWGDLFESMLKRTYKVKDSGHIIPGHGGILDRIDSLLFVAPVTYILYYIVNTLP